MEYRTYRINENKLKEVKFKKTILDKEIIIDLNEIVFVECIKIIGIESHEDIDIIYENSDTLEEIQHEYNIHDVLKDNTSDGFVFVFFNAKTKQLKIKNHKNLNLQIKIFSLRYKITLVAARADGLGERMCAFLNTKTLANLFGFDFKFIWPSIGGYDKKDVYNYYDNNFTPAYIFDSEYLKKYLLTDKELLIDESNYKFGITIKDNYDYYNNITILKQRILEATTDILDDVYVPFYCQFYLKSNNNPIINDLYLKILKSMWNKIGFNKHIKDIFKTIDQYIKSSNNKFYLIHLRWHDDLIHWDKKKLFIHNHCYVDFSYNVYLKHGVKKTTKLNFEETKQYATGDFLMSTYGNTLRANIISVIYAIKNTIEKGLVPVLVSQNKYIIKILLRYFNKDKKRLYCTKDFFPITKMNKIDQAISEIYFMSKSKMIYRTWSGFARTAEIISGKKAYLLDKLNKKKQWECGNFILKNIPFDDFVKSDIHMNMFLLGLKLKQPNHICETHIAKAYKLSNKSNSYMVLYCNFLVKQKKYEEVDRVLAEIENNDMFFWFKLELNNCGPHSTFLYQDYFKYYFNTHYKRIDKVAFTIIENINKVINRKAVNLMSERNKKTLVRLGVLSRHIVKN